MCAWLVEGQYLRRGFRLKSVSIAFQRCQKCLEAGLGSIYHSKFTVTRTFSSGSQLAVFELKNWHFNHDSCQKITAIIIHIVIS
ncbi:hypothetical protein CFI14_06775 [Lactiplantibacillus pentosus]|nr:hypothetical protein CFK27_09620 [Lactiplantibacillus pentosus]AYG40816.1 hypothetical protein CFI14_06775 [Lactiplantibacillus pentosus]MCT3286603.1 hypothetical protein [Lactiplantibacillus pentosus]